MSTVPDKKTSKSRTKRRYKKWVVEKRKKLLNKVNLVTCPQCKEKKISHTICPECGAYGKVKDDIKKAAPAKAEKAAPKKVTKKKEEKKPAAKKKTEKEDKKK